MTSLEERLTKINLHNLTLEKNSIYPLVDLTLLNEDADKADLQALNTKANQYSVAAICVYPKHLPLLLPKKNIQKATVVNFPAGDKRDEEVLFSIEQAITLNEADEIDYVFPYQLYLDGEKTKALESCGRASTLCRKHQKKFKVIIETGALSSLQIIYDLSLALIDIGCDFIKTSTGKVKIGATIPAVFAILSAIKDTNSNCGIKVSGGIRNCQQASEFINISENILEKKASMQWFRIGTSGLDAPV
jgi:deoxyribose-phosphate aldolase